MLEENKAVNFLKKNVSTILVVIISIFYIFWGSVEIVLKKLEWWELICYICTTLVFGICITNLIGEGGFTAGKTNKKYIETRAMLIEYCDLALPYKEEAIKYVNDTIDADIKEERTTILNRAAIMYDEIFDENAKVIVSQAKIRSKGKYTRKQRKSIRQAIKIKKYDFTLFAYSTVKNVGRKKEQSEHEYRAKGFGKDFIIRIFLAVISGSIMFAFGGFTASAVIYAAFQMILWIASGVMKRSQNFNFIVDTLREADKDRIGHLKAFIAYKGFEVRQIEDKLVITKKQDI